MRWGGGPELLSYFEPLHLSVTPQHPAKVLTTRAMCSRTFWCFVSHPGQPAQAGAQEAADVSGRRCGPEMQNLTPRSRPRGEMEASRLGGLQGVESAGLGHGLSREQ